MNAKSRKPNKQSHIGTKNISTKTEKPIYKIAKTGLRKQVFAKLDNKPRTTTATLLIRDLLKSHAVSVNFFLTAVSHCPPINTSVIYTRTHALSCGTNVTARNVAGCSNPNVHAFPHLIISDHY